MSSWRVRLGAWIAGVKPARAGARLYGGARNTRTTGGFGGSKTSADAELSSSLNELRSRSRQAVRDAAYAKRAKAVIVNNVIGTGMGLQAQVLTGKGELAERINSGIESAWRDWATADACHTGGALAFGDFERAAMGEVFEAGEVFVRLHYSSVGRSRIPLALELVEAERIASDYEVLQTGSVTTRMGIELDAMHRPVAYWLRSRHPGDFLPGEMRNVQIERVPAADILHLRVVSRWPQTRGEPWMHAVVRKLDDLNEYSQHEITAARASAAYFATIESPDPETNPLTDEVEPDGQQVMQIESLSIQALNPGEKLQFHSPNRPNSAFAEFNRAMLREVASGLGISYEAISRDYSQSNYSSSRLALLDDRDTYRALQQWWIRSFREPLHRLWLQQAVVARAIPEIGIDAFWADRRRYEAALFKARGWSWVDPTREVNAYKEAIRAGMTTLTDVIAATAGGQDIEDVIAVRQRELQMLEQAGIPVDTTGAQPAAGTPAEPPDAEDDAEDTAQTSDSSADRLRRIA